MSTHNPVGPTTQPPRDIWQSAAWYRALSLTERIPLSHIDTHQRFAEAPPEQERAARRLHEWKKQRPFDRGTLFADRLAQDVVSEEELLLLLAESVSDLQDAYLHTSSPPEWLTTLQESFCDGEQSKDEASFEDAPALMNYLRPLLPLLKQSLKRLNADVETLCEQYTSIPFKPGHVIELLLLPIAEHILSCTSKVFVLEMHVARLQGELQGETPEERFQDFIRQFSQQERILSLLEEYPVLTRLVVVMLDQWVTYTLEFLTHVCADWPEIHAAFSPEQDPGLLVEIEAGAGDVHHQGRSVMILNFQSGLRLLYKPRSLAVDLHFQHLLGWLNEQGAQPPFRTITHLDKGSYGWSEFVQAHSCTNEEEIARFFERQGSYMALLYACNAIDMHSENVIASGEHPVLVDLEALFHPPLAGDNLNQPLHLGNQALDNSVFRVGLLPVRIWSTKEALGVDLSGMGGQEGQMTPFAIPRWEGAGTDQMRLVREQMELQVRKNRPKLNGEDVDLLTYRAQLLQGFTTIYRLLQERREALLTEVLPCFAQDEVRILFRPTNRYATLLRESLHPDLLRDGLERDRFFDRLWREVETQPYLARLLPAERRDLLRGDIPCFKTYPQSREVFTSDNEPLGTFFASSSLDLTRQRFQLLNEQDLTRQLWFIEAALSTLLIGPEQITGKVLTLKPVQHQASKQDLLEAACVVGNRLETLALRNASGASWLGVSTIGDNTWSLLPTDTDLYNGTSGIALFLAYLGQITGQAHYTELAKLSLATVRTQTEEQQKDLKTMSLGAFNGLGSALYLLTHLSVLWHDPTLLEEAEVLAELLPTLIEKDESLDIVMGVAGCILNLLNLHALHPNAQTLKTACLCGDHLLARAQRMDEGIAWQTISGEKPLGGFAHGTSGIALSLLKLAHVSGEQRYHQAALDALAYDRSLYLPAQENWADLRTFAAQLKRAKGATESVPEQDEGQPTMTAWCHGASGIGLGRVAGLPFLDDELARLEIGIAIKATVAWGLKDNHSLCHGAFGNLDLLLTAVQALDDPGYRKMLSEVTAMVLESITTCGFVAGVPLGVETPGLMTGLAGMGYELLRLAEPEKVPSVLLLEPPPTTLH